MGNVFLSDWFIILSILFLGLSCLFTAFVLYFVAGVACDVLEMLKKRDYKIEQWIKEADKEEIQQAIEQEGSLWEALKKEKDKQ